MARGWPDWISNEAMGFASLGLVLFAGGFLAVRAHRRKVPTAEQLEQQRREWLSLHGKLGGGEVLELQEHAIGYFYNVRGMTYTAYQDVSALESQLPSDRWTIIGGVGVRYDPRNPANSIVLSENWTGLRRARVT